VHEPAGQRGFAVIPRRRAVERTSGSPRTAAWLVTPAISKVLIRWAGINTITRRIVRRGPATCQRRRTFGAIG
jgi:hypothetical protein